MRIAFLLDEYLPESTRIHAKMCHDLALEFLRRGHEVVVISPGDRQQSNHLEIEHIDDVEIWRFKSPPTRGLGNIKRAINESLLSYRAFRAIRAPIQSAPFDICINYSPSIFFGPLASFIKKHGAYVYLVLRDFFPQWIIDEGMIRSWSPIAKYFRLFEHINYQVSDCIAVQSPANIPSFQAMYKKPVNLSVLMNWAAIKQHSRSLEAEAFLNGFGIVGKTVFFYGGNIGHAQDMSNILRLAKGMLHQFNVHFLLVGQGDEFQLVEQLIIEWELHNVTLLPSIPQEKYNELLSVVDVGLFSLSSRHFAHNFPGKLLGYMEHSLPILGSVNAGNDVIDIVNNSGAGYVSVNGDDDAFLGHALKLAQEQEFREKMGSFARALLKSTFSVASAADAIIQQATKH